MVLRISLALNLVLISLLVVFLVNSLLLINQNSTDYVILLLIVFMLLLIHNVSKNYVNFNKNMSLNFQKKLYPVDIFTSVEVKSKLFKLSDYKIFIKPSNKIEAEILENKTILVSPSLEKLPLGEALAIILHEVAHDVLGHVQLNKKNQLTFLTINFLLTLAAVYYFVLVVTMQNSFFAYTSQFFGFLIMLYITNVLVFLKGLRSAEFECDTFVKNLGYGYELRKILTQIEERNNFLTPLSTHPKIKDRVSNLQ